MDANERRRWEDFDFAHMYDSHHVPTTIMGKWAHDMAQNVHAGSSGEAYGGSVAGGTASAQAGGGGILDGIFDLSEWLIHHIWPLSFAMGMGLRLAGAGWKAKGPLALLGGLLVPGLLAGPDAVAPALGDLAFELAGENADLLMFAMGAVVGWLALPLMGLAVVLAVAFLGLALALAIVAGALGLAWVLLS